MRSLRRGSAAALFLLLTGSALGCGDDAPGATGAGGAGGGDVSGVPVDGLSGAVTARYDEHGILHLSCTTDDDCYAALGYFHAQNRFFFMDFVRNLVRGKLGALVQGGDVVLQRDYANRHFFATPEGEPLEEKLYADGSPETRGHLDAYTRGVNAWIGDMQAGRNGATLTTEYDFSLVVKDAIRAWDAVDSAAVGLYVLDDLSNNSGAELALAEVLGAYDGALAADLFSGRPVFDAFTKPEVAMKAKSGSANLAPGHSVPGSPSIIAPAAARAVAKAASPSKPSQSSPRTLPAERLAKHRALFAAAAEKLRAHGAGDHGELPGEIGSNNWAVGPSRTASKHAMVANDPHLQLTNPSIWFPVELDAKSNGKGALHIAGSTFPGLPAVMVGHNEQVGWGVTTAYWDLADVYLETLTADNKAVLFDGKEVPIVEKTFSFFDVSTMTTIEKTFRWVPHHGPLISEDAAKHTGVSVRWVGHAGGTDLDAFYAVGNAHSVEEARQGIELACAANQNFVVVDVEGHLGWFPFGKLPVRSFASSTVPPWLPLPGDGSAEWSGYLPMSELPQLYDPVDGQIATANQDMTGASADGDLLNDGQKALQAWSKSDGTRQQRILELLALGKNAHGTDTLLAMQADSHSLLGKLVATAVLDAAEGATLSSGEKAVVAALAAWDGTCPTGLEGANPDDAPDAADATVGAASIGCTAAHAVLYAVVAEAFADEIAAAGVAPGLGLDLTLVMRALREPASLASGESLWDDVATEGVVETRSDTLRRGLTLAAEGLAALGEPNAWRWGRVHTLTLRSIFDAFGIEDYNDGPYAAPGGLQTVNVASPRQRAIAPFSGTQPFAFAHGPSIRFVIEAPPEGPRMHYQLPGGIDLHRDSPFYNNLLPNWLVGEPILVPFGPGAVTNPASTTTLVPAQD